jgi:hypothetical protein
MTTIHNFIIVSYFTVGTPYATVAHDYLIPTLEMARINCDVRGVISQGSWIKNTSFKSTFVRQMLDKHPNFDIVFVDCDAEVVRFPFLFMNIPDEFDIAVHYLDRGSWYDNGNTGKELLSGTIYFRNNENARRIVDNWVEESKSQNEWDQKVLQRVLENEKVFDLPLEYCYIKNLPDGREPLVKVLEPVIVHNQVSRKLRSVIR